MAPPVQAELTVRPLLPRVIWSNEKFSSEFVVVGMHPAPLMFVVGLV